MSNSPACATRASAWGTECTSSPGRHTPLLKYSFACTSQFSIPSIPLLLFAPFCLFLLCCSLSLSLSPFPPNLPLASEHDSSSKLRGSEADFRNRRTKRTGQPILCRLLAPFFLVLLMRTSNILARCNSSASLLFFSLALLLPFFRFFPFSWPHDGQRLVKRVSRETRRGSTHLRHKFLLTCEFT